MKHRFVVVALVTTLPLALATEGAGQGSLTPPGSPAVAFKTLQQIEPRTDIATLAGDGASHHIISQSGSYYLTANLAVSLTNGIRILATDVTLDLNGFRIFRGSGTGGSGVAIGASSHRVTVRDGTISGFADGVTSETGIVDPEGSVFRRLLVSGCTAIAIEGSEKTTVEDCTLVDNSGRALHVSLNSVVRNCLVQGNGGGSFSTVYVGPDSLVQNSLFNGNSGQYALETSNLCTVMRCSFVSNSSSLGSSGGLRIQSEGLVVDCFVAYTFTSAGTQTGDTAAGIVAGSNSTVRGCITTGNRGDGITAGNRVFVTGNNSSGNGVGGGSGAALRVAGNECRVEDNHLTTSDRGLEIAGSGNIVRNNTVRANTDNYVLAASNQLELLLSQLPETIDVPALVRLAGPLTGTSGASGITVAADDVTIDLAGHALIGVAGSIDGITVSGSRANLTVQNGAIRSWGADGINALGASPGRFSDLDISSCGNRGIAAGSRSTITKVKSSSNVGVGILTSTLCALTECVAFSNTGDAISLGETSTVERCLVNAGQGDGIVAPNNCFIRQNTCDFLLAMGKAGIRVTGSRCRIEENHVSRSRTGIVVTAAGNLIIKNSCLGNSSTHSTVAGNLSGTWVSTEADLNTATNSNVNIGL